MRTVLPFLIVSLSIVFSLDAMDLKGRQDLKIRRMMAKRGGKSQLRRPKKKSLTEMLRSMEQKKDVSDAPSAFVE